MGRTSKNRDPVRHVLNGGRRAGNEVPEKGRSFLVRFPDRENLDEQKPGQDDCQAQSDGERTRLEMTGRTGPIRMNALFRVEEMNEQGRQEEAGENPQENQASVFSAHRSRQF
jgi:hypothetical protein